MLIKRRIAIYLVGSLVISSSLAGWVTAAARRKVPDRLSAQPEGLTAAGKRSADAVRVIEAGVSSGLRTQARPAPANSGNAPGEVAELRRQLDLQQHKIDRLETALEEQKQLLLQTVRWLELRSASGENTARLEPALLSTPVPARSKEEDEPSRAAAPLQDEMKQYTSKVDALSHRVDDLSRGLGGFKFSGDFRYRMDAQLREGNETAVPLQNIRSRYRLRLNLDKDLDSKLRFHAQLSTGPLNNGITNDQDFSATVAKHPFSIAEAYIDFHPNSRFSMRGGRMDEVFADNMRFLWDDDVRFNGFQQIARAQIHSSGLGFKTLEFRNGIYFLSNPNVVILAPGSPFVQAGFRPGSKVRDAMLFHPGLIARADLSARWNLQLTGDVQLYRNPNQIQLASLANGFPVLVSNAIGIALSGPMTGLGNATTTPGGAVYSAPNFQILRLAGRLENKGVRMGKREAPLWFDLQASRNMGTSRLRDAIMGSINLGSVRQRWDTRFLYQYAIKDANSLISQFTDDDLGTGTGVNIAVHAIRFDLGLNRFLQWQNLFFVQNERRTSNPVDQLFIPLQRGAKTTYRFQGQLAFTF